MIGLILDLRGQRADRALAGLIAATADPAPAMRQIGAAMRSRVLLGFRESKAPDGAPWAPIFHRRGQPLIDTARLRKSINWQLLGNDAVAIGTNVEYAERHQEGLGVKARPFIPTDGLPGDWQQEIIDLLNKFLSKAADG